MAAIVPYFGYRDAAAAIDFLSSAFGLEQSLRYDGDDGAVMHAEMTHGDAVIMLGGVEDGAGAAEPSKVPAAHGVYLVVEDVDGHHERAVAAGAEEVYPPEDTEFGTRRWRARDPEGYEWSFGSYAPAPGGEGGGG